MKSLDKDGDSKLSKEEVPEQMKDFFDTMDTNKDGFVDAKELAEDRARRCNSKAAAARRRPRRAGPAAPGGGGP